jgi:hypothetical protein
MTSRPPRSLGARPLFSSTAVDYTEPATAPRRLAAVAMIMALLTAASAAQQKPATLLRMLL